MFRSGINEDFSTQDKASFTILICAPKELAQTA
jgi:hypothetical protein